MGVGFTIFKFWFCLTYFVKGANLSSVPQFPHLKKGMISVLTHWVVMKVTWIHTYQALRIVPRTEIYCISVLKISIRFYYDRVVCPELPKLPFLPFSIPSFPSLFLRERYTINQYIQGDNWDMDYHLIISWDNIDAPVVGYLVETCCIGLWPREFSYYS